MDFSQLAEMECLAPPVQSDETLITAYFPIPKASDLYQERAKTKYDTKLAKIPKSIIYFGDKGMLE